jgi:hypothetical protein
VLIVAPNMTDLNAAGGGSDDYSKRPKGNLDPTGEYFIWTTNLGTNRNDAFIVRIPVNKLGVKAASPAPTPPAPAPTPSPTPEPTPAPAPPADSPVAGPVPAPTPGPVPSAAGSIQWMSLINAAVSGGGVVKTSGCDGCPDASAVSEQQIAGNGTLTFVASESSALRFAGWSAAGIGAGPGDINFALRLQGGVAEVRESGAYRSEIRFRAGDSFAIAVENGTVRYSKNGTVFYSSAVRADYAMRVHVVLFSASASIGNVAVGSAAMSAPSAQVEPARLDESSAGVRYAIPRPEGSIPRRRSF